MNEQFIYQKYKGIPNTKSNGHVFIYTPVIQPTSRWSYIFVMFVLLATDVAMTVRWRHQLHRWISSIDVI